MQQAAVSRLSAGSIGGQPVEQNAGRRSHSGRFSKLVMHEVQPRTRCTEHSGWSVACVPGRAQVVGPDRTEWWSAPIRNPDMACEVVVSSARPGGAVIPPSMASSSSPRQPPALGLRSQLASALLADRDLHHHTDSSSDSKPSSVSPGWPVWWSVVLLAHDGMTILPLVPHTGTKCTGDGWRRWAPRCESARTRATAVERQSARHPLRNIPKLPRHHCPTATGPSAQEVSTSRNGNPNAVLKLAVRVRRTRALAYERSGRSRVHAAPRHPAQRISRHHCIRSFPIPSRSRRTAITPHPDQCRHARSRSHQPYRRPPRTTRTPHHARAGFAMAFGHP